MLQSKKLNVSMIAVVVLSVLLAVAIATASTLAWFASSDAATGNFALLGPVQVELTTGSTGTRGSKTLAITDVELVPSKPVEFDIAAQLNATTTASVVRARFVLEQVTAPLDEDNANTVRDKFLEWIEFDAVATTGFEWKLVDGWYYLVEAQADTEAGVITPAANTELVIIDSTFRQVPSEWSNAFANAAFSVRLEIQAMQADYWGEPATEGAEPTKGLLTFAAVADQFVTVFGADSTSKIIGADGVVVE